MIAIVNGSMGAGKTSFESMVCRLVGENKFGYIVSTIDFVKDVARKCGWDGTKTPENRKFLSDLKDLLTDWNDIPFKKVKEEVETIKYEMEVADLDPEKSIIFIDCREPKEIKRLCEELGAKSLLIRRATAENEKASNHADADVLNYNYDIVIENNGTIIDLYYKAYDFAVENGLLQRSALKLFEDFVELYKE